MANDRVHIGNDVRLIVNEYKTGNQVRIRYPDELRGYYRESDAIDEAKAAEIIAFLQREFKL